ncbi:MAG: hypothetical protein J7L28_01430 [Thermotogae bacterium]|nr:hypothetical protein [Thermotogota bacterium]
MTGGKGLWALSIVGVRRVFKDLPSLVNGLAGLFDVMYWNFGFKDAVEICGEFIGRFKKPLLSISGMTRRSWFMRLKYSFILNYRMSTYEWKDVMNFIDMVKNRRNSKTSVEVFDLVDERTRVFNHVEDHVKLMLSIALPGFLPPFEGRYVSSSYYSFIPVENLMEGDLVIHHFPRFDLRKLDKIADVIAHVADLRAVHYAKLVLKVNKIESLDFREFTRKLL